MKQAPEYTSKVFDFLLLLLEKFQVLYRIPDTEPLRVFIPSLLPSSGEEGAADAYSDRDGVILASPGMLGRMQDHVISVLQPFVELSDDVAFPAIPCIRPTFPCGVPSKRIFRAVSGSHFVTQFIIIEGE